MSQEDQLIEATETPAVTLFPMFITPFTAVKKLEHYCGGSFNAKLLIADKIRDGEIRAYAKRAWISKEPSLRLSRVLPTEGFERKILIPRSCLIGAESWTENVANWKWRAGDFYSVLHGPSIRRQHFKSVRLAKDDVEQIVTQAEAAKHKKLSARGRPTKLDAWNEVWRSVLRIVIEEEFSKSALVDMQRFRAKVLEGAFEPGRDPPLDDETVAPLLNSIYREFVDRGVNY